MVRKAARQQVVANSALPAPVGGWNARDAIADMAPTDAIQLDNWFPRPDRVTVRNGRGIWATGVGGAVQSLLTYSGPNAKKFFAAGNGKLFDITANGAVGAAAVTSLTSNKWGQAMFSTAGGAFMVIANGADSVRNFDGTNWTTPSISGVTSSTLTAPNVYRFRLFFIQVATLKAWYLPISSIAGAAQVLDFGPLARKGGYLVGMGTWTTDGGEGGTDDLAVFLTSEGELFVCQGSDPSSASSWELVGRYEVARPIGTRCLLHYGADLCLLLEDGFYQLSTLIAKQVNQAPLAVTDKIRQAFADACVLYSGVFGWEAHYYALGQRLVVNVPDIADGTRMVQYVQNSISGAWCRFTGLNAQSWGLSNGVEFFGDASGNVWWNDTGTSDSGTAIPVVARQAFSDFGAAGRTKFFTMVRPRFITNGNLTIGLGLNVDYQDSNVSSQGTAVTTSGSAWGHSWVGATWQAGDHIVDDWHTVGARGTVASVKIVGNVKNTFSWFATDFVAQVGGIL